MLGLKLPSLRVIAWRSSGCCSIVQPICAPTADASRIAAVQNPSTNGSSSTRSVGAPVIADTGLIVMLPHNLYQMSRRTSADTVASKPACFSVSPRRFTRSDSPPAGSPTIRPWPILCSTSPGSEVQVLACTTQPITCSSGMAFDTTPAGSTLSSGALSSAGTPRPNHHGTPFIAGSTSVCGSSSGWMCGATPGSD